MKLNNNNNNNKRKFKGTRVLLTSPCAKMDARGQVLPTAPSSASYDTRLHDVCLVGNVQNLARLIRAGVDVNSRNKYGDTPLHSAAYGGFSSCIRALLQAGCIVDTLNHDGMTALRTAESRGKKECVLLLRQASNQQCDRSAAQKKSQRGTRLSCASSGASLSPQPVTKAWRPSSAARGSVESALRDAQGILNKMTVETYDKLSTSLVEIARRDPAIVAPLAAKVFEHAVLNASKFCAVYADLCTKLWRSVDNFRKELLNKCQQEFEGSETPTFQLGLSSADADLFRMKAKLRATGTILLIAELWKRQMMNDHLLHGAIVSLLRLALGNPGDAEVERLVEMMHDVGYRLEKSTELQQRPDGSPVTSRTLVAEYMKNIEHRLVPLLSEMRLRVMVEDLCARWRSGWRTLRGKATPVITATPLAAPLTKPCTSAHVVTPALDLARFAPAVVQALDEFLDVDDPADAKEGVQYALAKDFPAVYAPHFVLESIKYSLGKSECQAARVHALLISSGLFPQTAVLRGLQMCITELPDLSLDQPHAARTLGIFAGTVHRAGFLQKFEQLWSLFDSCIDEGPGFGIAATALGFALMTSFRDNISALAAEIAAEQCDITVKLRAQSRGEAGKSEFFRSASVVVRTAFATAALASATTTVPKL